MKKKSDTAQAPILICGGAGYIGSHMVRTLLEAGRTPVILDDLSTGHRQSVPQGVELVEGSLADRAALGKLFRRRTFAGVMHFSAHIDVGESVANPRKYYRNNLANGLNLLEAMLDAGVKRLVFSSSCAVCGQPDRIPLDEDCGVHPISPYGQTKAMFEQILRDFESAYGLRWAALRYFNAAGAMPDGSIGEDHDPETHLIPLVLRAALAVQRPKLFRKRPPPLRIFGGDYDTPDGTCIRDYVHVLDLASAHIAALDYLAGGGASGPFNLANEQGFSVRQIIEVCEKVTGVTIPHQVGPRRPGDPPRLIGSAERARRVLGWQPRYGGIETIIQTAWRWHESHPRGYTR